MFHHSTSTMPHFPHQLLGLVSFPSFFFWERYLCSGEISKAVSLATSHQLERVCMGDAAAAAPVRDQISCSSKLSASKGGSRPWRVEGAYEYDDDDEVVLVSVDKEDPLGGPKGDREVKVPVEEGCLNFRGVRCPWASPPPDALAEELAAMSLRELKAFAVDAGLDPSGCIERADIEGLLRRARASGALASKDSAPAARPPAGPAAAVPAPQEAATVAVAAVPAPVADQPAPAAPPAPAAVAPSPPAEEAAAAAAAPTPPAEGQYSLEQLTDKRQWEKLDVTPTERETFLPDAVFVELFGMGKAEFAKLPKWKKDNAKKKHGLF
ncbi:unnamed protein product [Prorocentrum cordatum]|uniref:HP domain-containing protein n=1 Tax=Prorocentrum cordatum TaxID=2364126 RepID=A0ABN9RL68_9DINO|nr:unnamed protein product [Polarella glacialis]